MNRDFLLLDSRQLTQEVIAFLRKGSPTWPNLPYHGRIERDPDGQPFFTITYDKRWVELYPDTFLQMLTKGGKRP